MVLVTQICQLQLQYLIKSKRSFIVEFIFVCMCICLSIHLLFYLFFLLDMNLSLVFLRFTLQDRGMKVAF